MCNHLRMACGHTVKQSCGKPVLTAFSMAHMHEYTGPIYWCQGLPADPTDRNDPCYECIINNLRPVVEAEKPAVDEMKLRRLGAGNDNWGFSSRGMTDFGEAGESSWSNQEVKGTTTDMDYIREDRVGVWPWNDSTTMLHARRGAITEDQTVQDKLLMLTQPGLHLDETTATVTALHEANINDFHESDLTNPCYVDIRPLIKVSAYPFSPNTSILGSAEGYAKNFVIDASLTNTSPGDMSGNNNTTDNSVYPDTTAKIGRSNSFKSVADLIQIDVPEQGATSDINAGLAIKIKGLTINDSPTSSVENQGFRRLHESTSSLESNSNLTNTGAHDTLFPTNSMNGTFSVVQPSTGMTNNQENKDTKINLVVNIFHPTTDTNGNANQLQNRTRHQRSKSFNVPATWMTTHGNWVN